MPLPPTFLLNTLIEERRKPSAVATLLNPNIGNSLAVLNYNVGRQSFANVYWRIGDTLARPNAVGYGHFKSSSKKDSHQLPPFQLTTNDPFYTALDPILQIETVSSASHRFLGIRTATCFTLHRPSTVATDAPTSSTTFYEFFGRNLNRRPIADMALGGIGSGLIGSGLLVDVQGGLYGFGLERDGSSKRWPKSKPNIFSLRSGYRTNRDYGGYASVIWGGLRGMDAVVGLEDEVLVFDLRVCSTSLPFLSHFY